MKYHGGMVLGGLAYEIRNCDWSSDVCSSDLAHIISPACRAPQGARGLKFVVNEVWHRADEMSRPARGAWVEILPVASMGLLLIVAPRKGRVG